MTSYIVTSPLVIIPNADGTSGDGYFYQDALVPDGWNDERTKVLAKEGMLAEAKPAEDDGPRPGSEAYILAEVGDDKVKAQAALDEENAKESPRKGLTAKLEKIVGA